MSTSHAKVAGQCMSTPHEHAYLFYCSTGSEEGSPPSLIFLLFSLGGPVPS
jgi:hypothetical protein